MGPPTAAATAAKSTTVRKASIPSSSPKKKGGKIVTRKDNVKAISTKQLPTLTCYGFAEELPIEAYIFCKDDNHDAFCNGFKCFADGKIESEALSQANFTCYKPRRVPQSKNEIMKQGTTSYWRIVMVRHVPDGTSTKESRVDGLRILKTFLMSTSNTDFPPTDITTMDCTNVEDKHSLDSFFIDKDIVEIIKNEFDEEDMNKEFFMKYSTFAKKLWSGPHYNDFARELGFP